MKVDLLEDPLPTQQWDSHRWRKLFRLIVVHVKERELACMLLKRMWMIRSIGTVMRRDLNGIKLEPLLDPDGGWPDMDFWNAIRKEYLVPYSPEIKRLIELVAEETE